MEHIKGTKNVIADFPTYVIECEYQPDAQDFSCTICVNLPDIPCPTDESKNNTLEMCTR